jgi:predicted TIM-barrel fold metal-dependent hydrolase
MVISDSGLHVWEAPTPERPFMSGRKAHIEGGFSYDNLINRMDEAGVSRAILIPPSWQGDSAAYSLEAVARYPGRFAVVGRIPLATPESRQALETLRDQPGMLGIRLTFQHDWEEESMRDGSTNWVWPIAQRRNIPIMLNVPTVLKEVRKVAELYPDLRLIIDHMGRKKGTKDHSLNLDETIELAQFPNVCVKLSLAAECSSESYPYRNIHAEIKRLIEAFTPKRCFWGSDLTVLLSRTEVTYRQAITMFTEEMGLSKSDLEWIMGRGLSECLGWPVA